MDYQISGLSIRLCIPFPAIRCHESFPYSASQEGRNYLLVVQAYCLEIRTVNLRSCISASPVRYVSCGKGKPTSWNGKFWPQGFPGKSPHPIGVVFCLKNLPYPLCDLLESHRNETNGDRNTQKKTKDSRSSDLIQLGSHFTAPEAA